jgi:hypothetical protein
MREEKRKRQFIFSSHNATIPVLGDAEQIVGLTPMAEGGSTSVKILPELCGSIDVPAVKELVKSCSRAVRPHSNIGAGSMVSELQCVFSRPLYWALEPLLRNVNQTLGELNWSSQQPEGGSCDGQWKAAFGTIWAAAIVVTRSTTRGRTRRAATVLGRHRVRHGK